MIIQACLNAARTQDYHPALPLTIETMVQDSLNCLDAGASELHIHARDLDGKESLLAVETLVLAIRSACPGTLFGVSTGE